MALFGKLAVIIACADQDRTRRQFAQRQIIAQRLLDSGNRVHLTDRRRRQIGEACRLPNRRDMTMRVDEAGQQRAALQIDMAGLFTRNLANLSLGSHRDDLPPGNRDCFDGLGRVTGHCDDWAALIDRNARGFGRDQDEGGTRQEDMFHTASFLSGET